MLSVFWPSRLRSSRVCAGAVALAASNATKADASSFMGAPPLCFADIERSISGSDGETIGAPIRRSETTCLGEDIMDRTKRRDFMRGTAIGALAFTVGGVRVFLTARDARAQGVPFRLLKANEAEAIEALGETLLPGARAAGISHFIDQQISVPPEEALL